MNGKQQNQNASFYRTNNNIMNTFQITSDISTIYPDIEGELCSKHTVHLNRVQRGFRKAFTMHDPTHYVISKPIISLARAGNRSLSMALEQGTVIMYAAGEVGDHLNISSNVLDEQITLEANGKLINSQQDSDEIQSIKRIAEIATDDLSLNIIKGGFLYVHCSDGIEEKSLKESMLIGLFMSIIGINGLVQEYTKQQLINKLLENQDLKDADIEAYFMELGHRQLIIKGQEVSKVSLDKKYKLLMLSLDILGKQFYQISENNQYAQIFEDLSTGKINFLSFFQQVASIQQKQTLYSEITNFCSTIKTNFKLKSYILCSNYAIFLIENYKYAEAISKISSTIHRLLTSQAQNQDKLSERFNSKININSFLFSTVPSQALFVLDPSNSIWF